MTMQSVLQSNLVPLGHNNVHRATSTQNKVTDFKIRAILVNWVVLAPSWLPSPPSCSAIILLLCFWVGCLLANFRTVPLLMRRRPAPTFGVDVRGSRARLLSLVGWPRLR